GEGSCELELRAIVELEQLVCVTVLLVVVDEPGIRRRRDDAVEASRKIVRPRVAVDDRGRDPPRTDTRELLQPRERVQCVTAQELRSGVDRTACPLVLVTPVRLALRNAREVEIEVRRPSRRS